MTNTNGGIPQSKKKAKASLGAGAPPDVLKTGDSDALLGEALGKLETMMDDGSASAASDSEMAVGSPSGSEQGTQEATTTQETEKNLFIVYSRNCLRCNFLTDLGKYMYEDCHFTKGNTNCPAAEQRIVIGVNVEQTAKRMKHAFETNDLDRLGKIQARLQSKDPVIVKQVLAEFKRLLNTDN